MKSNRRWPLFWVLAVQYLVVYFHRVCPAVVAPELITTFHISGTALGVLASGYFYSYAVMQIPVGLLSDSWGTRKTVTLFTLVAATGALLFAVAPTFGFATFARILVGFGVSATFVASLKTLALWFSGREYARISGLLMAVGGIGWFSASTPLAFVTEAFGWRSTFLGMGGASLILAGLTWSVVRDIPEEDSRALSASGSPAPAANPSLVSGIFRVFGSGHFWPLAIWLFFAQGTLFAFFGLWAGPFLIDTFALSKPRAGSILSMLAIGMIFGGPFLGWLSDRVLESRKKVIIGASLVNVCAWITMTVVFDRMAIAFFYAIFFVMGITTSAIVTVVFTSAKELFPVSMAGTSIGTANLFSFFGGLTFQPLIGSILDLSGKTGGHYLPQGYRQALGVFLVINILSLVASLFLQETFAAHRD